MTDEMADTLAAILEEEDDPLIPVPFNESPEASVPL